MAPSILILTGPPGVGKTTVGDLIAAGAQRAVHMHTDDFFDYVKAGFVQPWLAESREQNHTISRAIAAAACQFALGGYDVVVDGIVGPWHLDMYRQEAARTGVGLDYVVLRLDRATCVVRARDRAHQPLPDYPPGIWEQLMDLGDLAGHGLEAGGHTTATLAAAIAQGRASGRFRLA